METPRSVIQPGLQFIEVGNDNLLGRGFGMHLGRVDLVALQHVLHQRAQRLDYQLALVHAVVGFDDGLLLGLEARVLCDDHLHRGVPAAIGIPPVCRSVIHQVGSAAKATQHKVTVVGIALVAVGTHMPAHAGVDQRVRGNQPRFAIRGIPPRQDSCRVS